MIFTKLRDYFELLPKVSIINSYSNEITLYRYRIPYTLDYQNIFAKISRTTIENGIIENISYSLENGAALTYSITKKGKDVRPTPNHELLTFNFKASDNDESYVISIPILRIQIADDKSPLFENSFFTLGFMEASFKIESVLKEQNATLSYLLFFSRMRFPQVSLTVQAYASTHPWEDIQYIWSASNGGVITPNQFFKGLEEISTIFTSASDSLYYTLLSLGFPKIN